MNCTNNQYNPAGIMQPVMNQMPQNTQSDLKKAASTPPFSTPFLNDENRAAVLNNATSTALPSSTNGTMIMPNDTAAMSSGSATYFAAPQNLADIQNEASAMEAVGNNDLSNPQNNIPETVTNTMFWPAYLRKFIGKWVRVDFFIGDSLDQHIGQLLEVGASYIVLNVLEPETIMICDIFAIKFVTVVLDAEYRRLYG